MAVKIKNANMVNLAVYILSQYRVLPYHARNLMYIIMGCFILPERLWATEVANRISNLERRAECNFLCTSSDTRSDKCEHD